MPILRSSWQQLESLSIYGFRRVAMVPIGDTHTPVHLFPLRQEDSCPRFNVINAPRVEKKYTELEEDYDENYDTNYNETMHVSVKDQKEMSSDDWKIKNKCLALLYVYRPIIK